MLVRALLILVSWIPFLVIAPLILVSRTVFAELFAEITYAVVAIWVVFVPTVAVGAVGASIKFVWPVMTTDEPRKFNTPAAETSTAVVVPFAIVIAPSRPIVVVWVDEVPFAIFIVPVADVEVAIVVSVVFAPPILIVGFARNCKVLPDITVVPADDTPIVIVPVRDVLVPILSAPVWVVAIFTVSVSTFA